VTSDYPPGRGRVRLLAAGIEIEGVSIAGHESFYKLPGFRTLLEFGRAPDDVVGYANVCVTHGHLDHMAGLAHHASRRRLGGLPPARVLVPAAAADDVAAWLAASERLESVSYGVELRVLPGRHRVPTVGYLFSEVRHKLVPELEGLPGAEIAQRRARGETVARREEIPLLAYPGDCSPDVFDAAPELFQARVLLIECSFLLPEDVDRARDYAHIHLADLVARADLFENEAIVLTHFSQRYRPEDIREALAVLPDGLREKVIAFLPE
jgi:ribonuclease Z